MKSVTSADAKKLQDEGWAFVDVRSEPEFEAGHPSGAVNVPLNAPNFVDLMKAKYPTDTKLILACQVGARSLRAGLLLEQSGWSQIVHNAGGFNEWLAQKLPTSKGKS